jgi:hypothetical protein
MRTAQFLISGLLLMAALLIVARLFAEHVPSAPNLALGIGLTLWLAITAVNMWLGVTKAGYSVSEELPIVLLLFGVPAVVAALARWRLLALVMVLFSASGASAQVPDDLRAAMSARDRAFYAVNAAEWEKYTAPTFTTVQQDGSFLTRAERLANLKTQPVRPYVPRSREVNERRGDVVVARFFSGGLWVVEVWTRETGTWTVLMSQVTTAKP